MGTASEKHEQDLYSKEAASSSAHTPEFGISAKKRHARLAFILHEWVAYNLLHFRRSHGMLLNMYSYTGI
jgi:hypothetical protein